MGQHAAPSRLRWRTVRVVLITVVVLAVVGVLSVGSWYFVVRPNAGASGRCPVALRVVTASSFAPVLATAGRALRSGTDCVQVDVNVTEGRAAAGEVARANADVWIPDDGAWTATVAPGTLTPTGNAGSGTVLATSPIYMVTDRATAERIRAAGGSWLALSKLLTDGSGVRLVVRNPSGSGDGMVGAGAVGEAVWLAKGMDATSLALADTVRSGRTVDQDLTATPQAAGEVGLIPEYALLPTLAVAPPDRGYLTGADRTALLRFTFLPTTTGVSNAKRARAVARLRTAFDRADVARALMMAGLRGPANVRPRASGADLLPAATAKPFDVLAAHHVQHIFAAWDPEDRRSNLLVVVDVATPAGPAKAGTRPSALDVLRQGCRSVADLLPDGSRLGLWEVGVNGDPPRSFRELLPVARLDAEQRTTVNRAVGALAARRSGPGLLDAIVDAYTAVRDDYQSTMFNQVLVFTDDQNADTANADALSRLNARLTSTRDPERPVQLSVVVLGQPAAVDRLQSPLKAVDAYVDNAVGADDVQAAFIHVLAGGLHE